MPYKILIYCSSLFLLSSCKQAELYERLQNIPKTQWQSSYKPSFTFNITDTVSLYNIYITIRHTNQYAYQNIWVESNLQLPGDTLLTQKLDLQLATTDGWNGVGMDDIYEHSVSITPKPQGFKRKGAVTFTLAQIMRQNPLPNILQVGIRVEKVP